MTTLVYLIASTQNEFNALTQYIPSLYTPKSVQLLIVLNGINVSSSFLSSYSLVSYFPFKNSLNSIICWIASNYEFESYMRLDPDDLGLNLNYLDEFPIHSYDVIFPSYKLINDNHSYILLQENGLYNYYETLAAGTLIPYSIFVALVPFLACCKGQDNFILWLYCLSGSKSFTFADSTYSYVLTNVESMSIQTERIVSERYIVLEKFASLFSSFVSLARINGRIIVNSGFYRINKHSFLFVFGRFLILIRLDSFRFSRSLVSSFSIDFPFVSSSFPVDRLIPFLQFGSICKLHNVHAKYFDRTFSSYLRDSAYYLVPHHAKVLGLDPLL